MIQKDELHMFVNVCDMFYGYRFVGGPYPFTLQCLMHVP